MKNIIFIFLLAVYCTLSYADDSIADYLKKNRIDFNTATDLIQDSIIQNNQFFLVGERHGYKANYKIAFKLLEELKRKTDIKYIIAEADWAWSVFLNQALLNEDTIAIKDIEDKYKGSPGWTKEHYDFYKNLIKLNKKYENKIQLIGCDIDPGGFYNSIKRINELKEKYYEHEDSILNKMKDLYMLDDYSSNYICSLIQGVDNTKYSTKDKQEYRLLLYNILDGSKAYHAESEGKWDKVRDSCMIENYKRIDKLIGIGDEKMFGEWGTLHTYQNELLGINCFASGLNNDLHKSVYSYEIYYIHGKCNLPTDWIPGLLRLFQPKCKLYVHTRLQNNTNLINRLSGVNAVGSLKKSTKPNSTFIYNLKGQNSPFCNNLILMADYETPGVTTDYFQCIITVSNGEPCEALGGNEKKRKNDWLK